jgi:hypothetical protein
VDQLTGHVYIADKANNRVDEFEADGSFVRAWGWGVVNGNKELEVCTSSCQAGLPEQGAGAMFRPDGIAVSQATGDVYVIDLENDRVQQFTASGGFVRMWGGEVNKTMAAAVEAKKKAGETPSAEELAAENVCAGGEECQKGQEGTEPGWFTNLGEQGAIAIDQTSGDVYVGDYRRVQEFEADGKFMTSFAVVAEDQVEALTVTSGGEICLTVNPSIAEEQAPLDEVRCYSAAGVLQHTITLEESASLSANAYIWLAADEDGHIFVDEYLRQNKVGDSITQSVTEYTEAGVGIERLGPPGEDAASEAKEPGGLALVESGGDATGVMMAFIPEDVVRSAGLPPAGPLVLEERGRASTAGCLSLSADINPENATTQYWFSYQPKAGPVSETAKVTMAAHELATETVSESVCKLEPNTVYVWHVLAENANDSGKPAEGAVEETKTGPALSVDGLWAAQITEAGALLEAELNPAGASSEYYFQYVQYAPAGGGSIVVTPTVQIGEGTSDVRVAVRIAGLAANTVYDYKVVAHNVVGTVEGQAAFTTQRAGSPPALLDERVWEQVSPSQKHSAAIRLTRGGGVVEAAPSGGAVTYYASTSSESSPQGEPVPLLEQIISRHGETGWDSRDIATPSSQRANPRTGEGGEYWLFSEDLGAAVIEPNPFTALSQWTVGQERTPYLRTEESCPTGNITIEQLQQTGCLTPLLTDIGPYKDVEGGEYGGPRTDQLGLVSAVAATPDLTHVVLKAEGAELIKGAGAFSLYEWDAGKLSLLSETQTGTGCSAMLGVPGGPSNLGFNSRNALSPDGTLAVWGGGTEGSAECAGHLYLRDVAHTRTVQLDEVQGGSGEGKPEAVYQDASVGDQHVFFTDSQRLTANSTGTQFGLNKNTATTADLYEYAFDPATDAGQLVDMTVPVHAGEAAGVQGVLGASEDGSLVYLVAKGVLASDTREHETAGKERVVEEAKTGENNLYVLERTITGWKATFMATLSAEDEPDWTSVVGSQSARVAPNGHWLAFMSESPLTGYDNRDRVSGELDEEAFLYDQQTGGLVCASCNPGGARPTGKLIKDNISGTTAPPLMDAERVWEGRWLAAALPVRYAVGEGNKLGLYQPRYLSDGGRLFFDSTDALVPQDVNGTVDAYEYEPPANSETAASDSCNQASVTYSLAADGCVDLLSSGTSSEESVFLDASENGDNAFFLTASKLTSSDIDDAYDVYDAHSCAAGTTWQCATQQPTSPATCETTETCHGSATGGEVGALASEAFDGVGNLVALTGTGEVKGTPVKKKACPSGKHRHDGRCVRTAGKAKSSRHKKHKARGQGRKPKAGDIAASLGGGIR